jgi:hypothetical protein
MIAVGMLMFERPRHFQQAQAVGLTATEQLCVDREPQPY